MHGECARRCHLDDVKQRLEAALPRQRAGCAGLAGRQRPLDSRPPATPLGLPRALPRRGPRHRALLVRRRVLDDVKKRLEAALPRKRAGLAGRLRLRDSRPPATPLGLPRALPRRGPRHRALLVRRRVLDDVKKRLEAALPRHPASRSILTTRDSASAGTLRAGLAGGACAADAGGSVSTSDSRGPLVRARRARVVGYAQEWHRA